MRIFLTYIFTFFLFLLLPRSAFAQDFTINRSVTYRVTIGTDAEVTELITITNKLTEKYPQSYQIKLKTDKIKDLSVYQDENKQALEWTQTQNQDLRIINVVLPPIVGKNKTQTLLIVYKLSGSVLRQGEVTEINLPELNVDQGESEPHVVLELPPEYTSPAYMSPSASKVTESKDSIKYEFTQGSHHAIKAVFGSHQLYQFTIFYHLSSEDIHNGRHYLTFPSDTPYQRIALTQFSQTPEKISLDPDGNWIAQYPVTSANSPVVVSGIAMVFSRPIIPVASQSDKSVYLDNSGYWQINNDLKTKAQELGSAQKIYEYVIGHLKYDYTKPGTESTRQGAQKAFDNPTYANCMEFTDLFIAMTRAAGIASRRVIGYANSTNSNLQPVGLSGDILHAWAEYYDTNSNLWRPVDPTWAHTSSGLDYFSIWDLQHVALVTNGRDDHLPYPPGYLKINNQTKNIIVVPATQFPDISPILDFQAKPFLYFIPFLKPKINITISNHGNISQPRIEIMDDRSDSVPIVIDKNAHYIPPLGSVEVHTYLNKNTWLIPQKIQVIINGQPQTLSVNNTYRYIQIAAYIISFSLYAITCFLTFRLTTKAWRLPIQKRRR